jgi:hypothetical protein
MHSPIKILDVWSQYGPVDSPLQNACQALGNELYLVGLAETTTLRHPKQEPLGGHCTCRKVRRSK